MALIFTDRFYSNILTHPDDFNFGSRIEIFAFPMGSWSLA